MRQEMDTLKSDGLSTLIIAKEAKSNTDEILAILRGLKFWGIAAISVLTVVGSMLNIWKGLHP